jgi:tRNA-dihydrouridine synthase
MEETGVDAIMIGRAAIGNPAIFEQVNDYMKTGKYKENYDKMELFKEYLELAKKYNIEFGHIKARAIEFTKGKEGGAKLRAKIGTSKSEKEIIQILDQV